MNFRLNHIFILCLVAGWNLSLFAQGQGIDKVGTTSFQFLKVMPDARSTALGEAFTSVVSTSEAVFWNPAALTRIAGRLRPPRRSRRRGVSGVASEPGRGANGWRTYGGATFCISVAPNAPSAD